MSHLYVSPREMRFHFHPDRSGAANALDEADLVLVQGTPVYSEDFNMDVRIRVAEHGAAERATWITHHSRDGGLRQEFFREDYSLSEERIAAIKKSLDALSQFDHADHSEFCNDCIQVIRYHRDGSEVTAFALNPPDQYPEPVQPADELDAFWSTWELVDRVVPAANEKTGLTRRRS